MSLRQPWTQRWKIWKRWWGQIVATDLPLCVSVKMLADIRDNRGLFLTGDFEQERNKWIVWNNFKIVCILISFSWKQKDHAVNYYPKMQTLISKSYAFMWLSCTFVFSMKPNVKINICWLGKWKIKSHPHFWPLERMTYVWGSGLFEMRSLVTSS
jgi:hypothetical protein